MTWQMLHNGEGGCGKPAFFILEEPVSGMVVSSDSCRHIDGSRIDPGSTVTCDSCHQPVMLWQLRSDYIIEVKH